MTLFSLDQEIHHYIWGSIVCVLWLFALPVLGNPFYPYLLWVWTLDILDLKRAQVLGFKRPKFWDV